MKIIKKLLSFSITSMLVLSLISCGSKTQETANAGSGNKKYKVGVCQLVQHEALDRATQGFIDVLKKEFGNDIEIVNDNASGDVANCSTIVNKFVSNKVDLIMANATPALQAAASATNTIPILGTSITDYGSALEIVNFNGIVGTNVSGTSDLAPLDEQAKMVAEWAPNAKTCGIIYCSSEANSEYQVSEVSKFLKELNIEPKRFSFTDSNDIASVVTRAADEVDVLYAPTDNTVASNTETIANIIIPKNKILIAGEKGLAEGCGVATLSIDYYDLGTKTGEMAVEILKGEKEISKMPVAYAPKFEKLYNKDIVATLGLDVKSGYVAIE